MKLGTHVDSGWMYGVYQNQAAAAYSFLYFFFLQYSNIKVFVTLFSGTIRPTKLKLGTRVDNGWMYLVYQNQVVAAFSSLYSFIFLSLQFSNIKTFCHTFLRICEAYKVETRYPRAQWVDVSCILESGCCLFIPLFLHISFSPVFKH